MIFTSNISLNVTCMLVFIKNENPSRLFLNVGSSFIIDVNHDKHVVKAFFLTVEIAKI